MPAGGSTKGPTPSPAPIYHRLESPTQDRATALRQEQSGEIWGFAAQFSNVPAVKAYRGPLPPNRNGIEFTTAVPTTPNTGTPHLAFWRKGSLGVQEGFDTSRSAEFVWIRVVVTKRVPP